MKQIYISFNQGLSETREILLGYKYDIVTGVYKYIEEVSAIIDVTNPTIENNILALARVYKQVCILQLEIKIDGKQWYNVLPLGNETRKLLWENKIDSYTITENNIIAVSDMPLAHNSTRCIAALVYL